MVPASLGSDAACCGRGDGVCGGGKMAGDIERDLFLGGLPVLRQWLKFNHNKKYVQQMQLNSLETTVTTFLDCLFFSVGFVGYLFFQFQNYHFFVLSSQIWIMSVIKISSVCLMYIIFPHFLKLQV